MTYKLIFEERPEYLYGYVEGVEYSPEICIQLWKEIFTKAGELGYKKVLIRQNIQESLTPLEVLEVSEHWADNDYDSFVTAFVDDVPHQKDINMLGEVMARGADVNIRVFYTVDKAEQWLVNEK